MKIIFRTILQIIIINLFPCCIINAQETAICVKFKNDDILRQSLSSTSKSSLKLRSSSKTFDLVPSYPNSKNPELRLYYDIFSPN